MPKTLRVPRSALGRFAWRAFLVLALLPPALAMAMVIWAEAYPEASNNEAQAVFLIGFSLLGALWLGVAPLAGLLALLTRGRRIPPPA